MRSLIISTILLIVIGIDVQAIERRKDQSPREHGHYVFPYAMSMPGIGTWYGVAGAIENILETETDGYLATMWGDLEGYVAGVTDIPLYTEHLSITLFRNNFSKAAIESYDRGIDSDQDDYQVIVADKIDYQVAMVNLRFWEKRLQLYRSWGKGVFHLEKLIDKDGNDVADIDSDDQSFDLVDTGIIIDYTDDRQDPRQGARLEVRKAEQPRDDEFSPDYYRMDYALTGYIPVGEISTLVFTAFKSDAVVIDQGITDRDQLTEKIGIDCSLVPSKQTECQKELDLILDQTIAHNTYGTASALGGTQNMRSYPTQRFYAAHSMYYGTEFRWNLVEEFEAFDIFLAKGIRTGLQVAFFAEMGTVADDESELGDSWKHSYGTGFRLIMASGFVFRMDVATGEEGYQFQLFINYPWGLFM